MIELMVRAALSPLRRVTVFVELLPKDTFPKERGSGDKVTGSTPVPLKPMLCGLPGALSAIDIDPVMLLALAGLKTALMVQCAFGAKATGESGQLLLTEKGEGALGGVILEMTRGAAPVLVRRTDLTELVVPTA